MTDQLSPEEKASHDFALWMKEQGLLDEAVAIFKKELYQPGPFRRHVFGDKEVTKKCPHQTNHTLKPGGVLPCQLLEVQTL